MQQRPYNFDDDKVLVQLKYTGMLETTRIRREGYAARAPFYEFIQRFRGLAFAFGSMIEPTAENCSKILDGAGVTGWIMGKTKVFLR
jgi:myosin-3